MFSSSKSIATLHNFDKRFVENFVYELKNVKSDVYITTIDRRVNAKSVLGLLSLAIKQYDVIRIDVLSSESIEKAQEDLHKVLEMIEVI